MTPNQMLKLLRSGQDTAQIARSLRMPEAAVASAIHLAREEEYRAKNPHRPTFPAEREPLVAHYRRWRNVQIAQVCSVAKAGSMERAGAGKGKAGQRSV